MCISLSFLFYSTCFGGVFHAFWVNVLWWLLIAPSKPMFKAFIPLLIMVPVQKQTHWKRGQLKVQCQFYQWQLFPDIPIGALGDKEDTFRYPSFYFCKQREHGSCRNLLWPAGAEVPAGRGCVPVRLPGSARTQSPAAAWAELRLGWVRERFTLGAKFKWVPKNSIIQYLKISKLMHD